MPRIGALTSGLAAGFGRPLVLCATKIAARRRVRVETFSMIAWSARVIGNLGVGGREGSAPSLEVIEVDPIGSPRRGGDAGLDVSLDPAGGRVVRAITCTTIDPRRRERAHDHSLLGRRRLDCGS
jgi:hypothetical protein